jgi:hypothetical protein
MQNTDKNIFTDTLTDVFETLAGRAPSARAIDMWFVSLKDYGLNDVINALLFWTRNKAKAPAPADIHSLLSTWKSKELEDDAKAQVEENNKPFKPCDPAVNRGFNRWLADYRSKVKSLIPDRFAIIQATAKWNEPMSNFKRDWLVRALGHVPTPEDIQRATAIVAEIDAADAALPDVTQYIENERDRERWM